MYIKVKEVKAALGWGWGRLGSGSPIKKEAPLWPASFLIYYALVSV